MTKHLGRLQIQNLFMAFKVVSHTQRIIGCQPEKLLYTVANPARGLLNNNSEKRAKEKSLAAHPPPTPPPRCSFGEKNKQKNHATHLQALRRSRSISRPHKDSFDSSTRSRALLRKILRFRVR